MKKIVLTVMFAFAFVGCASKGDVNALASRVTALETQHTAMEADHKQVVADHTTIMNDHATIKADHEELVVKVDRAFAKRK